MLSKHGNKGIVTLLGSYTAITKRWYTASCSTNNDVSNTQVIHFVLFVLSIRAKGVWRCDDVTLLLYRVTIRVRGENTGWRRLELWRWTTKGDGMDDEGTRRRPQTPTPLRYCGQIIVDKSIGVNVVYLSKFPWERYSVDRRSLVFPPKRYSDKRRSSV